MIVHRYSLLFLLLLLGARTPAQTLGKATEGAWFAPATPGQGLVFDYLASESQLFGAWFTFASDGSGSPVWYTLQGGAGEASADFPLFLTTGGAFVASTPTSTEPVGMATLEQRDCETLILDFNFNDGRGGSMELVRLIAGDGDCTDPPPNRLGAEATIALVGVDILTMDEPPRLVDHTVIIRDGLIDNIGPRTAVIIPPEAVRIEGALVLPGFVDAHTHLATNVVEFLGFMAPQREIDRAGENQLWLYLAKGVTTIINNGDFGEPLPVWARAVRQGDLDGPTIYAAKYARGGTGTCDQGPSNVTVTTDAQARQFVRQAAMEGYDFIKTYNCTPQSALRAILDEAPLAGTPVIGHLPQTLGVGPTLSGGMQMVAHAEAFVWTLTGSSHDARFVPQIVDLTLTHDTWVTGTVGILELIAQVWGGNTVGIDAFWAREDTAYMHPTEISLHRRSITSSRFNPNGATAGGYDGRRDFVREIVRELHAANARLLIGTDSPTVLGAAGFSMYDELDAYLRAGLTAEDTLRIATRNGGDFIAEQLLFETERFGRVREGYRADLILLRDNPGDDLARIEDLISGVIARGRWYSRSFLDQRLEEIAADYATR